MLERETVHPYELEGVESLIYEDADDVVILPQKPLVPPTEGTNLTVVKKEPTKPYFDPQAEIAPTLSTFMKSLALGRASLGLESDDRHRYSQWVNIHLLPRFAGQKQLQVEVTGRNARGDTWAQPIKYPEHEANYDQFPIVRQEIETIKNQFEGYWQTVQEEAEDLTLFDNDGDFEKTDQSTIFQFQNFEVKLVSDNPHVREGGLHLWVQANYPEGKKPEGAHSDIKDGLEQFIIAQAVAKSVYQCIGRPLEIHFSGNWSLPIRGHWKHDPSTHANLYVAAPDEEGAKLPPRPGFVNPELSPEIKEKITRELPELMSSYLNEFSHKDLNQLLESDGP